MKGSIVSLSRLPPITERFKDAVGGRRLRALVLFCLLRTFLRAPPGSLPSSLFIKDQKKDTPPANICLSRHQSCQREPFFLVLTLF